MQLGRGVVGSLVAVFATAIAAQTGVVMLPKTVPLTSIPDRPWPAPLQPVADGAAPVLSPAEALKTFHMPPGYRLELVAAEPLVKDPILFEFDGDGRLWVMELPGYAINEKMENSFEPIADLVVLDDTNADGVFDTRTVFMDKLRMPRAFKVLDGNCALVGEPPNLWKACDTDGDLKSDTRTLVDAGFSTLGVVEHGANGLYWGMDNLLRVAEHGYDVRRRPDGTFETVPGLNRGQWGITQDDAGRIYRNVNTDPLFVDYVAPRYYARNASMARTSGLYETLARQEESMIWPVRPTLGLNRGYRKDVLRPDSTASYYGGVSSPLIYRGTALPAEFKGNAFVVDSPTNMVHALRLTDDGTGRIASTDYYKRGEFLASTDERFRPVALTTGPDGTLYIADMYRGVSQDGPLQTDYLKSYIGKRKLWQGINYGRIYRVVRDGMPMTPRPRMSADTPAQLVAHLSHPNGWWRDTAQQLLIQRGDKSVTGALGKLADNAPDWRARLHALWTLDGLGVLQVKQVTRALGDEAPEVRASAVRLSERWLSDARVRRLVLARADDANWQVRRQLAATLGELPEGERMGPIVAMLAKYGDDPVTVDAAISGMAGRELDAMKALLAARASDDAVSMLAAAASKRRDPAAAEAMLALAADPARPEAQRLALLKGLAIGLKGGGSGEVAVAGGRAGPIAGLGQRRGIVGEALPLAARPVRLLELASASGTLGTAAQQVAMLVAWPGKPAPPAIAPRNADEEKLFVAGRTVFAENCAACHTPNGRGGGSLAADLTGSKLVNGAGSIPVRILVHGKEGKIGLMPPLGSAMSNDDLAAVLTYIRGAWGNSGTPILPTAAKEWREAFAFRETPWTESELTAPTR